MKIIIYKKKSENALGFIIINNNKSIRDEKVTKKI
jgi:hypothetical protein